MSAHNFWNNFSHGFMHGMLNSNPFLSYGGFGFSAGINFSIFPSFGSCCGMFSNASLFMYPGIMGGGFFPLMQNFSAPLPIFNAQNYSFQNYGVQDLGFPNMSDVFQKTLPKLDINSNTNILVSSQPQENKTDKETVSDVKTDTNKTNATLTTAEEKSVDTIPKTKNDNSALSQPPQPPQSPQPSQPMQSPKPQLLSITYGTSKVDKTLQIEAVETNNVKTDNIKTIKTVKTKQNIKTKHWTQMTDAEMKEVYGGYSRDITKTYNGNVEQLNKYLKGKGVLEGKGQVFLDVQQKYGVSASALIGICMNESNKGKSKLAKKQNNVGGVRISGSTKFRTFKSVDECIEYMARFLKNGYIDNKSKSLTKLYQINAKYCPASDITDKTGENSLWARNVDKYAGEVEAVKV